MVSNFKYHGFCITSSFPFIPNDAYLLWFSGKSLRGKISAILVLESLETKTDIHCQARGKSNEDREAAQLHPK